MASPTPTLEALLGKTILVGITRLNHKEELIEQQQFVGTFMSMQKTICLRLRSGEDFTLPPDLSAFRKANPGIYRLRATGEEIENPDFTAVWTVRAPEKSRPDEKA
jgi:hypothetical protein